MSPELLKVAERAKREPECQFNSVAHLIDEAALARAYRRLRKDAGVGVDGVTVEQYGQRLEENLRNLHERMKAMRYRHQPIRRVHIPKEKGKTRPIGISAVEDRVALWRSPVFQTAQEAERAVGVPLPYLRGLARATSGRASAAPPARRLPGPRDRAELPESWRTSLQWLVQKGCTWEPLVRKGVLSTAQRTARKPSTGAATGSTVME